MVGWLDTGLRRGEAGRLCAEYPLSLRPGSMANHRIIEEDGALAAHAMLHEATIHARNTQLRVGMIGLVYTDPSFRGRGLATRCIESCLMELRRRGVALAILWSDKHEFYARMGFSPAGCELLLSWRAAPMPGPLRTSEAHLEDLPALERLYARKPVRVERRPGDLGRLSAGPATWLRVARDGAGEPIAYAVAGRGDDFARCVHEWAGDGAGVLACIDRLAVDAGARLVMAGPPEDPVHDALRERAVDMGRGFFALAKVLDADALWRELVGDAEASAPDIPHDDLLALCFGSGNASRAVAMRLAPEAARLALDQLPRPLYAWGLDSI